MTGYVKESDEYFVEEKRSLPCVSYRRAKVRDGNGNTSRDQGWSKADLPVQVAQLFRDDPWHSGGSDFPVHTVVTGRDSGKVIDVIRRRA